MRVLMQRDLTEISQREDGLGVIIEQVSQYGERSRIDIPFDSVDFFLEQLTAVCEEHLGPKGDDHAE